MPQKVRVGIIGLGFMGTTHFDIYQNAKKAEVTAIADVVPAKRKGDISSVVANIGGKTNDKIDLSGIAVYADGMDLINSPDVDLVDICVPTFLHKEYAMSALKAGKHVLCEKPLARTAAEAAVIVRAAKKSKQCFMTGMCVRTWPEYRYALEFFKSGKAGKLQSAVFRRLSPDISGNSWKNWFMKNELSGGALLDLHLHDADQIRYFFGKPKAVTAFGVKGVRSDDGIDHIVANYDFGDGSLVVSEGGWSAAKTVPFEMSFQIIGSKATVKLDGGGLKIYHENGKVETPAAAKTGLPTGWHVEIDYLLDCISNGKKPTRFAELDEYVDSLRIVEAEQHSIDKKKTVKITY